MAAPGGTVIVGAGIIGTSTAYYLSQSDNTAPSDIHLVESSPELFASASGYAGGFLAKDWFGPATASLGALSFKLHRELAEKHDGRERWGYSRSTGTSAMDTQKGGEDPTDWLREGGSRAMAAADHEFVGDQKGPAWLTKRKGREVDVISDDASVAQVDPLRLCRFLLSESQECGVKLHQPAKVLSVSKNTEGELASVKIAEGNGEQVDVPCTRLIITAGAWSPRVFSALFPGSKTKIPVSQLAGHSLVVRSPRWTAEHEVGGCHAVFATDSSGYSPEIFSRIGGEIYVAGVNDPSLALPDQAVDSKPRKKDIDTLKEISTRMLGLPKAEKDDLEVVREGLCFRPVTSRGPPLVSRVDDKHLDGIKTKSGEDGGVFLSAGHGPWGISQSLGTGKVISELVENLKTSANVRALSL